LVDFVGQSLMGLYWQKYCNFGGVYTSSPSSKIYQFAYDYNIRIDLYHSERDVSIKWLKRNYSSSMENLRKRNRNVLITNFYNYGAFKNNSAVVIQWVWQGCRLTQIQFKKALKYNQKILKKRKSFSRWKSQDQQKFIYRIYKFFKTGGEKFEKNYFYHYKYSRMAYKWWWYNYINFRYWKLKRYRQYFYINFDTTNWHLIRRCWQRNEWALFPQIKLLKYLKRKYFRRHRRIFLRSKKFLTGKINKSSNLVQISNFNVRYWQKKVQIKKGKVGKSGTIFNYLYFKKFLTIIARKDFFKNLKKKKIF